MNALRIQEPSRSRILALHPTPETILAWALEALPQDRIAHKPGFLVSVLQAGHAPPAELVQLVRLTVGQWRELARAARQARAAGWADLPADLAPQFEALRQAGLAGIDPARWPFLLPGLPEDSLPSGPAPAAAGEEGRPGAEPDEELLGAQRWWAAVLDALRWQMDPATFDAWLKNSQVIRVDGQRWTVGVGSPAAADWLGHRLARLVRFTLERLTGRPIDLQFQ